MGEYYYDSDVKTPQWIGTYSRDQKSIAFITNKKSAPIKRRYGLAKHLFGIYEKPKEFNSSYRIGTKKVLRLKDLLQFKIHKE